MNDGFAVPSRTYDRTDAAHLSRRKKKGVGVTSRGIADIIFGLNLSTKTFQELAEMVMYAPRTAEEGLGIIGTINIQHFSLLRHTPGLEEALVDQEMTTCDGFPLVYYAKMRGLGITERTTGREIVGLMMTGMEINQAQRWFFVVDGLETGEALTKWAEEKGIGEQVRWEVPPPSLRTADEYALGLAKRIAEFGTTALFMCLGAPSSELFLHKHRALLGPCWAMCVGQSARIVLGLSPEPPAWVGRMNIEWAWRIMKEPRRLTKRYITGATAFTMAIVQDVWVRTFA